MTSRKPRWHERTWVRRVARLLPLVPPFALAFYAFTEPWARARVTLVWGVTRSPGATVLLASGLAAACLASVFVAWSGRRARLAGGVHLATGLALAFVAWQAFTMVREAGVKAFWLLPLVSVRPGQGLWAFALAAALLALVGLAELGATSYAPARRAAGAVRRRAGSWRTRSGGHAPPTETRDTTA